MKPLWLVGEHIDASPSPAMHNAALEVMGQPPVYALKPCGPGELNAVLDEAERTCRGINLTAPHKIAAAHRYESVLDDDAQAAGAVNTVVYDDDGRPLRALNTDVEGLLFSWRRSALHVEKRTVAVIGGGGAARAVAVAAALAGASALVVHTRRNAQAQGLVAIAASVGLEAVAADEPCGATLAVVAASALEEPERWIARALDGPGAVHELRYGAQARAVRDAALAAGHVFADGSLMLLAQAQGALGAFLGTAVPELAAAAMRRALVDAVSAR